MLAIGTAELHCRELMKGANVERIEKWSARMKEWRRHSPFLDIKLGLRERWRHGKQYFERQVTWCAVGCHRRPWPSSGGNNRSKSSQPVNEGSKDKGSVRQLMALAAIIIICH